MKKSFWSLSIATALILGSVPALSGAVKAESIDDLNSQKQEIQQEREQINSEIDTKNTRIDEIIVHQNEVTAQIKELDAEIEKTTAEIETVSGQIDETNAQIAKLQEEIEELKLKIAQRTELLEERARAIQLSGGSASYVDVLLGAQNFGDFIDRFSAVNTLVTADRKIMEEQRQDQESLEKKEQEVKDHLAGLEVQKEELDHLYANLDGQKSEKSTLMAELEAQQKELEVERSQLEEKDGELYEMEAGIEQEILAEQERLAELARQRELERQAEEQRQREAAAAEAEAAAAEAEAAAAASQASTNSSSSSSSAASAPAAPAPSTPAPAPAVSAGAWTTPAYGRTTSEFGYDVLNGSTRIHYGIDVAAPVGTPIVAAASGYVQAKSGHNGGYGNMIMITHSINGRTYTTVYAHLSSIGVSNGSYVEKGQYIGGMGNTGYSFGSHLHFELHEGGWNGSKSNAVNPRKYISF
ncbi:murein hydrolase activator EnvC family protein [Jeotgalibacillus soli]|uniref:Uncharacterized protein n=1 Tax=Jeotgalibacillus soli TaxID=889306 RepID=A0A0C2W012_9BACL|nr:peptidoglycan DD-metalloendopeptidase family protein [Jeotgalibacillus soli]KIL49961.1 hypothetical protein KP78_14290 [Jeotgalibacillus soli]